MSVETKNHNGSAAQDSSGNGAMWKLTIRYPGQTPRHHPLQPGLITIGRKLNCNLVLSDTAVSRQHAEIDYDLQGNKILIRDLQSVNGTFVNLRRLDPAYEYHLRESDLIQIGATELLLTRMDEEQTIAQELPPERPQAPQELDGRSQLLYETARQLNTVLDTETALQAVSSLMQEAMEADRCEVILASQFDQLRERGFSLTIASIAMDKRAPVVVPENVLDLGHPISETAERLFIYSALCVPVMSGDSIIALIYLYKTDPKAPPFSEEDQHIAEAVSHMVALTVERMNLFQRIHDEQRLRQLLQCHLPPATAEYLLHDYLKTGRLPGLGEQNATVLFADIADSTGWAERLGAKTFGEVLRRYYQEMTDVVFEFDGLLDKYLGDGVMALFGLKGNKPEPEIRAIQAGLAMIDCFEHNYRFGSDQMHIGVGVNTGPVVAGYVSTKERVEFAVLGDAVNIAFGLQALARPNRLFIGPETWQTVQGRLCTRDMGTVGFKARSEPVHIHEVLR